MHLLDECQVVLEIDFSAQLYFLLVYVEAKHLEGFLDDVAKVEIVLAELERVVFHLSQVQKVVDEVLHHAFREDLLV